MMTISNELQAKGQAAKTASRLLAKLSSAIKNQAIANIADALENDQASILVANHLDMEQGKLQGLGDAILDRLLLTPERLVAIAMDVRSVKALADPVGVTLGMRVLDNGLQIGKRRVPLGVVGVIYESRPNVTIDISTLCIKSGNAVILRGGRESIHSNKALAELVRDSLNAAGVPAHAVQFIESIDRVIVNDMLKMRGVIDLLIPRGGADLIRMVAAEATMPVVTGGIGVCHTYVDSAADTAKATAIAYNAKVQRPTVCNALDTILVHSSIAPIFLPMIAKVWSDAGVEMHCDSRSLGILTPLHDPMVVPASADDWGKEFLSLTAAIKVVDTLDEALEHIDQYGSGHSEAIVTENYSDAMRFLDEVDAAVVMVNASTRFTDGGQFGLGAEVAISTNKFHARGPMGLEELTSYKWTVLGTGQVRP